MHKVAGSGSRIEALAVRLNRSGKKWTLSQYLYASLGVAAFVTVVLFLRTGALFLSLGVGVLVGAGLPHMVLNFHINKRSDEPTSELQSLMRISSAVFCLKIKTTHQ